MAVVPTRVPGVGRRKRNGRKKSTGLRRGGGLSAGARASGTYSFSKVSIKGNDKGCVTFGPNMADYDEWKNGVLRTYAEYKITKLVLQYKSTASSTDRGAIYYQLDPGCKKKGIGKKLNMVSITSDKTITLGAVALGGEKFLPTEDTDQFKFWYEGDGANTVAGNFIFTMSVQWADPQ